MMIIMFWMGVVVSGVNQVFGVGEAINSTRLMDTSVR